MAYPIPGASISTPYGKRGGMWGCEEDSSGNGIHTGVDFAASSGTRIYAPISGDIRHRSYGSAFGNHQFAISPDDNEPFGSGEVFFAHTRTRLSDGTRVNIGDFIAEVGSEGNSTGPHLHMEYMPNTKGVWHCGIHANPQPILDYQSGASSSGDVYPIPTSKTVYLSKLRFGQEDSDSVWHLQDVLNGHPLTGGATLPLTGGYFSMTDAEVIKCQVQHGFGADLPGASFVGEKQAAHLFDGKGYTVVYDI